MSLLHISTYLSELIAVASIATFMAIIPGVDFVMVTRTSIREGRFAGLYITLGICLSICLHATYTLAGLAVVISHSQWAFIVIQYSGAAYLIYLGYQLLKHSSPLNMALDANQKALSAVAALRLGFMTNLLNPKAPLFFLSIFTQVVAVNTPLYMQVIYALIIVVLHLIWFSVVSLLLSSPRLLPWFHQRKQVIDKLAGCALVIFAVNILW